MDIFTIGHSTRSLEQLVELLRAQSVGVLVDIRTIPRSRKNPQFNREEMEKRLPLHDLRYEHWGLLGGLRRPHPHSGNLGWRNAGFRGYADYMQSAEFERALSSLVELARSGRVAVMCAEGNPYRCHRSLLADALTVCGITVRHISSAKSASPHRLTPFARVEGTRVSYPG
jgi:uncharacterized protein (DUF488 family)